MNSPEFCATCHNEFPWGQVCSRCHKCSGLTPLGLRVCVVLTTLAGFIAGIFTAIGLHL